jgi:hypothetical protein
LDPSLEDDILRILRKYGDAIRDITENEWTKLKPEVEDCLYNCVQNYEFL